MLGVIKKGFCHEPVRHYSFPTVILFLASANRNSNSSPSPTQRRAWLVGVPAVCCARKGSIWCSGTCTKEVRLNGQVDAKTLEMFAPIFAVRDNRTYLFSRDSSRESKRPFCFDDTICYSHLYIRIAQPVAGFVDTAVRCGWCGCLSAHFIFIHLSVFLFLRAKRFCCCCCCCY